MIQNSRDMYRLVRLPVPQLGCRSEPFYSGFSAFAPAPDSQACNLGLYRRGLGLTIRLLVLSIRGHADSRLTTVSTA